tara:strand:+ start:458 stop:634 length:177 start_codon:yes stop_codon:yes gene_type:complete
MIKRLAKYNRKLSHIKYVRDYVCNLHNDIFAKALSCNVDTKKAALYKKYNRYLKILEL